ncbi:MAG TPA: response regulator [Candidatus Paceibacterota bacterium]
MAESEPTNQEKITSKGEEHSVLLIEDDELLSGLLVKKFKEKGFKVFTTYHAEEVKTILENTPIDIIGLDLLLPGLDGFSFLEEMKKDEKFKKIPVLIMSNLGQKEEIERGLSLGAAGYIVKANSSPASIVEKAEELLGK